MATHIIFNWQGSGPPGCSQLTPLMEKMTVRWSKVVESFVRNRPLKSGRWPGAESATGVGTDESCAVSVGLRRSNQVACWMGFPTAWPPCSLVFFKRKFSMWRLMIPQRGPYSWTGYQRCVLEICHRLRWFSFGLYVGRMQINLVRESFYRSQCCAEGITLPRSCVRLRWQGHMVS